MHEIIAQNLDAITWFLTNEYFETNGPAYQVESSHDKPIIPEGLHISRNTIMDDDFDPRAGRINF
jgi:hypothetical protein